MKSLVLLVFTFPCLAATPADADRLFQASEWRPAADAYEALLKQEPTSGFYWFRLGLARNSLREFDKGLSAFEKARDNKYLPPALYLRAATASLNLSNTGKALEWIEALFRTGYHPAMLATVQPLAPLMKDPSYQSLAAKYNAVCNSPQHRALDFWIGEWDVRTPQGQPIGSNHIERTLNGCALHESWTNSGIPGVSGRSFSWFDDEIGKWRQVYLSAAGGTHEYTGEAKDGKVIFLHDRENTSGGRQRLRMTFSPISEGKVHQFIEESWDGKNWTTWFDGIYHRR